MNIVVITPPAPIVTPADIAGDHATDDPAVTSMIAAVTGQIDGPTGWLGRAIGPQTLEMSVEQFCGRELRLRCPPVIAVVSLKYLDTAGIEQTVDSANYRIVADHLRLKSGFCFPATACEPDAVRIRYQAGYNGEGDGKTGSIPERARWAIILSVQHLLSLDVESLYLRVDEVEGVGRREFTLSDQASLIVNNTFDRLLDGLRIFG